MFIRSKHHNNSIINTFTINYPVKIVDNSWYCIDFGNNLWRYSSIEKRDLEYDCVVNHLLLMVIK